MAGALTNHDVLDFRWSAPETLSLWLSFFWRLLLQPEQHLLRERSHRVLRHGIENFRRRLSGIHLPELRDDSGTEIFYSLKYGNLICRAGQLPASSRTSWFCHRTWWFQCYASGFPLTFTLFKSFFMVSKSTWEDSCLLTLIDVATQKARCRFGPRRIWTSSSENASFIFYESLLFPTRKDVGLFRCKHTLQLCLKMYFEHTWKKCFNILRLKCFLHSLVFRPC